MKGPYQTLLELETDVRFHGEMSYRINFDKNNKPLRVILSKDYGLTQVFIYRRGGVDLTRDQAADLIRRNIAA